MFSVRLVSADSYQASPLTPYDLTISEFRNSKIKNVPTIRVFGSTLSGEKVCLHIHGVFPYMYVPYVGGDNPEVFAYRLAESLDSAINISFGSASADTQHVYKIQQVKGVPFYGFHEKRHHYFKIYFYNPAMIKRAADLLQNGSVLNQTIQPHEAHIPFILQFMIDYNIYGMSLINLKDVKYRQANRRRPDGRLNNESLTPHFKTRDYLPPTVKRQSVCEIEVDAWASDIQNKEAIEQGLDVNPGLAAIWAEEKARRILAGFEGGDSQLGPPSSPPRSNLQPTDNDLLQMQRFQRKLVFISQSEESSVSMNSNSSYPVEVDDEFNLLDASHLERHIGPQNDNQNRKKINSDLDLATSSGEDISLHLDREKSRDNSEEMSPKPSFEAIKSSGEESSSQNQNRTLDHSIFDTEDVPLVDILEKLAEGHETDELVDDDSILGSHCSAVVSEYKSDEDVENGVPDLNLTTFEIDALSLNSELTLVCSNKSKSSPSELEKVGTPFALQPLSLEDVDNKRSQRDQSDSQHCSPIPQFDGADDLPRKRSSSVERSALKKRRKVGNENKDVSKKVADDMNKKLNNVEKEELRISCSNENSSVEPDLDRTLVPEEKEIGATISETSESTDDLAENAEADHTLVVEEKLICNYKSSAVKRAKKEAIVNRKDDSDIEKESLLPKNQERRLESFTLLQSPKRALRSSDCNLRSPSCSKKALNSPQKALRSPSRRSPRKSLQSPRRSYSSLNITVTPSKRQKELEKRQLHGISEDDESSGDAPSKGTPYFTQKRVTGTTNKDEACDAKANRKLPLSQKEMIVKSFNEKVFKGVSTSRKLVLSPKSEDAKCSEDNEIHEKLFLSQKSQVKKRSGNEAREDVSSNINLVLSEKSRTEKSSEDDENYGQLFLSQKSQYRKHSEDEFSDGDSPNRKIVFSKISRDEKSSEDVVHGKLFLSQKSQVRKHSKDEELLDNAASGENLSLSQKSASGKCFVGDDSSNEALHEMPLTQKPASEKSSQDEKNSEIPLTQKPAPEKSSQDEKSSEIPLTRKPASEKSSQDGKSSETQSNELNLLDIDNISPHLEKNNVYDEETDSSDFEENLEVLLKNVSFDSNNKDPLPPSDKSAKKEEQHLVREENPESENINSPDLDITEEINNEVCNAKDLLTVTFTEFTNSQVTASRKLTRKSISGLKSNRLIAITTKFCAPTRQHIVESMDTYGIPTCRNQEPFYSDRNDIRARKDTVHQIINKKDVADFPPFKSEIGGVVGIKLWRRMKVNEFHTSNVKLNAINVKRGLTERRLINITPLHLPPDRKQVVKWMKARKRLKCKEKEKVEGRKCEKEDKGQGEDKSQNKEKGEKEDKRESSSSRDEVKLNPFGLNPISGEIVDSGEKSRESFGNDSSLCSTLRPSDLLISGQKKKKKLGGVTFGQVDFSMDESKTQSDVANQNLQNAKAITTYQYLTILCLEVHVTSRKDLLPDPQYDRIDAVFYAIHNDVPPTSSVKRLQLGAIIVDLKESRNIRGLYPSCAITYATCEEDLFCNIVSLISECNPDILIGWELETLSWGYVLQRAGHLGTNLAMTISRIPGTKCTWESQAIDLEALAEIKLPGRIVLDVWRIMRHEIALLSYTFENVMYHVMHKRLPCPSFETLTKWWYSEVPCLRWRVLDYYIKKIYGILELLDQLDIIGRTCEHARLFGIQFFEVFSRGSQFRVESMMLRLTKPLNYVLVSPSVRQRAAMRAPEALPLIMEPVSTFYSDPVIVLDFQSLYPSIIIAYNYCFSTCLGRVEHIGQRDPFEFGCTTLKVTKNTALKLQGKINFSPVGIGYVKPEVRKGILPRMLSEILNTRLMVKKSMKDHSKDDRSLQQVLHNRQLGLKLIANVTYGYTAANFSGRMPCIEVGDSIVSKGKETLERAIKLVEDTPKWGARVVYGDTDSLFILLSGKSRNDAFKIGAEIADAVTAANPSPVKLKFEKVLHPCILQTKKRYCGYSYETVENEKPEYLGKGIETVRRDGCPAAAKILEKSLKILFDTKNLSQVKQYVTRQLDKVFRGTVSIQDLTFAREFRGLRGYKKNACVPALELTRRLMKKDPRAVPRTSERVPYIIVAGAPNEALIHSVRSPTELLTDPNLRPNAIYYITRVIIPPLNRCLNLLGADVNIWFRDMPHREVLNKAVALTSDKQKATISQFFNALVCLSCGSSSENKICKQCVEHPSRTIVVLHQKLRSLEKNVFDVDMICRSCTGQLGIPDCESLDCPVTYRRSQVEREYALVPTIRKIIDDWEI